MKLSNQHKAYVAVLGLGIAGLLVDRFVLGHGAGPASASASVTGEESLLIPSDGAAPAEVSPHSEMVTVAARLAALAKTTGAFGAGVEVIDAFVPPAGWDIPLAAVQKASDAGKDPAEPSVQLLPPGPELRLSAVVRLGDAEGQDWIAMIAVGEKPSRAFKVGDEVFDGVRLKRVHEISNDQRPGRVDLIRVADRTVYSLEMPVANSR